MVETDLKSQKCCSEMGFVVQDFTPEFVYEPAIHVSFVNKCRAGMKESGYAYRNSLSQDLSCEFPPLGRGNFGVYDLFERGSQPHLSDVSGTHAGSRG